jgi:GR25 family glycosyltransferase involved in LPS biosynthesis
MDSKMKAHKMKAYSIVIKGNETSERGYTELVKSSISVGNDFQIERLNAVTPADVEDMLRKLGIAWNYPWEGSQVDIVSGLKKTAYATKNPEARIACALSHFTAWCGCIIQATPMLVLEHDAYFVKKLDIKPENFDAPILGINDPRGATRKSQVFFSKMSDNKAKFQEVPWVDDDHLTPQGLAGNSAYIIKPEGAEMLVNLIKKFGLWPNDAIMCRQLVPTLGISKKIYTTIQKLESTTTA